MILFVQMGRNTASIFILTAFLSSLVLSPPAGSIFIQTLPKNTAGEVNNVNEEDLMIGVKKRVLTNWSSLLMSQIVRTVSNQKSKSGSTANYRIKDPYGNIKEFLLQYNCKFHYGIIARKGILMQIK